MLKLYIRPVCLLRPEEEVASLSLLVERRREKVRTIKGKENRSRSIAAGLLLRHMLLEEQIPYAEESFGLEGHGKPRLKKDGVFFNLSHAGAYLCNRTTGTTNGLRNGFLCHIKLIHQITETGCFFERCQVLSH